MCFFVHGLFLYVFVCECFVVLVPLSCLLSCLFVCLFACSVFMLCFSNLYVGLFAMCFSFMAYIMFCSFLSVFSKQVVSCSLFTVAFFQN